MTRSDMEYDLPKYAGAHLRALIMPLLEALDISPIGVSNPAADKVHNGLARNFTRHWDECIIRETVSRYNVNMDAAVALIADAIATKVPIECIVASMHGNVKHRMAGWDDDRRDSVHDKFYATRPMCTTPIHRERHHVDDVLDVMPSTLAGLVAYMFTRFKHHADIIAALVQRLDNHFGEAYLLVEELSNAPAILWGTFWCHGSTAIAQIIDTALAPAIERANAPYRAGLTYGVMGVTPQ